MSNEISAAPSPKLFFETLNGFQRTAAIKGAVELDFFTAMADGPASAAELAQRCGTAKRGARILADYLTILGFLTKSGDRYALTPESALFLNRKSPAYVGGVTQFLLSPELRRNYDDIAATVRKGGTAQDELGTIAPEHPIWLEFARGMAPMMRMPAQALAEMVPLRGAPRVLDIAASHGMWGMAFAQKYPRAQLVALDWAPVLELTRANAERAGLMDRFSTIAGNAFEVDFGSNYDAVLIPNFLHHFNKEDCVRFLKKVRAALRDGGRVAIAEFVPNPDRVSPPEAAAFSFVMLAGTPEGDAYTLSEYEEMLAAAGFAALESHDLPPMWTAIIAER
ncbi:MAG TPA: class I SAM-dependent methyltransferase [Chthoniobacterales bacterium]|jgi:ubiquinone/menaquinone biosynthesis C-methylase UbiE|nr:class I SAM-dependent methyltransferase [Chthoniobacterales bacterium]